MSALCPNCGSEEFTNEGYCPNCEYGDDTYDDELDDMDFDDNDRELSYARLLHRQGVECTCEYCKTKFIGMPSHGVCNSCADTLERGGDPQYSEDDPSENM